MEWRGRDGGSTQRPAKHREKESARHTQATKHARVRVITRSTQSIKERSNTRHKGSLTFRGKENEKPSKSGKIGRSVQPKNEVASGLLV